MILKNNVYVIAEAGVNHNGNLNIAKKLILAAKGSGADAIKFQNFTDFKKCNQGTNSIFKIIVCWII